MRSAYYAASIQDFLLGKLEAIRGKLLDNSEFNTVEDGQKEAWTQEIEILQEQLFDLVGGIAFEYTVPRIGHRIDVVVIVNGIIFLLEFKAGSREYKKSADEQVMDYALDLKYFHKESQDKYIVPVDVSTKATVEEFSFPDIMEDKITKVVHCNAGNIGEVIRKVAAGLPTSNLDLDQWLESVYSPTPTIIEAAQALYRNHQVDNISRHGAEVKNLSRTTDAINKIIDKCKAENKKAICFVTGVPGAGKTLAGLNIANARHQFESEEHAVFLSGNGPLVDVLQAALAQDQAARTGITKKKAEQRTKAFIQIIHKFRDSALISNKPPIEKVAIFDEAQRAWNEAALTDFMARKKGVRDFNQSEPDFLISIMDRHNDWSVIVCLVGGGQEIYAGEAGIVEWFRALKKSYPKWEVYLSDKMTDAEYLGGSTIADLLGRRDYQVEPSLHLSVSLRSFRSGRLSDFVKYLLDNKPVEAAQVYAELREHAYHVYVTREFSLAKAWIKEKARGSERYGLLASSEGKRLRGEGIWVPAQIDHVAWFLQGKDNVNSSYRMEVTASEFKVQGLELDYVLLCWDADFRYEEGGFKCYKFRGRWNKVNKEDQQAYMKNAYRVLMTRARQGMVIYVPEGADADEDATRKRGFYDGTYNYLLQCGIEPLLQ